MKINEEEIELARKDAEASPTSLGPYPAVTAYLNRLSLMGVLDEVEWMEDGWGQYVARGHLTGEELDLLGVPPTEEGEWELIVDDQGFRSAHPVN